MALLRSEAEKKQLFAKTSFMSVEKILGEIVERLILDVDLKKLLYYSDKHALSLPPLDAKQTKELIGNHIRTVPKVESSDYKESYVIITLNNFKPGSDQTFKNFIIGIDIIVDYDNWQLDDFKLRPHAIAGEIDKNINKLKVGDNGIATFVEATNLLLENSGGLSLYYVVQDEKDT